MHDFLVARAEEDWPTACSHLTKTVAQQLQQLASQSGQLSGAGCAKILAALTPPLPAKVQKESTIVDAGSLRTEGEQAFLIYRGSGRNGLRDTDEAGRWRLEGRGACGDAAFLAPKPQSRQMTWSRPGPTPTSAIGTPTKSAM